MECNVEFLASVLQKAKNREDGFEMLLTKKHILFVFIFKCRDSLFRSLISRGRRHGPLRWTANMHYQCQCQKCWTTHTRDAVRSSIKWRVSPSPGWWKFILSVWLYESNSHFSVIHPTFWHLLCTSSRYWYQSIHVSKQSQICTALLAVVEAWLSSMIRHRQAGTPSNVDIHAPWIATLHERHLPGYIHLHLVFGLN